MPETSSSYPIIRTKLHRPPVSRDHLRREHLLDRLNNRQLRPLILVSAPAGYGKSTLVSFWLDICSVPNAWVSLDENDNDLKLFLLYFISAIQRIFPGACGNIISMLKAAHIPPDSTIGKSLFNELDLIGHEFILVLDDFHLISNKRVQKLIAKLLEHNTARMQLVLVSRRDPPLPLSSWRAKGKMVEIRTEDLRFSLAETIAFLQQTTGVPIDNAVALILDEKIEGWVTGLHLAAYSLRHHKDLKGILSSLPVDNRFVMEYAITEILSQYSHAEQECLLKISLLNRICPPLCEAVCGSNTDSDAYGLKGHEFLELLNKADLFIRPMDDKQEWFRYHHLFQTLLQRHFKKHFTAEDISGVYKLASAWSGENGYIEEAFAYAFESGDKQAAAQLVKQHRHDIMQREQWYQLAHWLQKFPTEFIQQQPDLLLIKAWIYQRQARYSKLFDLLDGLEHAVSASCIDSNLQGEVQVLKSFQYYSTAQAELAETSAREALDKLPVRFYSIRGFAFVILSNALQMQGKYGQAQSLVHEAMQQEEASESIFKTMLLAALCYTNWAEADLNNLKLSADQLLKHGQKHNLPESVHVGCFFTGIFHYQRNELDFAEHSLTSIVSNPIVGELVIPSVVTYCQASFALSLTYQAKGRVKEASEIAESLISYMLETGNADLLEICQVFKADLALRQGHIAEADFWAQSYIPKPVAPVYRFFSPYLTLPKVLLARQTAQGLAKADTMLSQMYDYYVSLHSKRVSIDVLALQALLRKAQGDESGALEKLKEALGLAEPGGFVRPFLDLGPEMADLMKRLIKQNPTLKYARQIHESFVQGNGRISGRRHDDRNNLSLSTEEFPVTPLSNREIEIMRVLARGLSNDKIAETLYISPETVKRHLSTIYSKLEVKNRHQAVLRGKSLGIL